MPMFVSPPIAEITGSVPVAAFAMLSWFTALAVVENPSSLLLLASKMAGKAILNCKPAERMVAMSTLAMTNLICAAIVEVM